MAATGLTVSWDGMGCVFRLNWRQGGLWTDVGALAWARRKQRGPSVIWFRSRPHFPRSPLANWPVMRLPANGKGLCIQAIVIVGEIVAGDDLLVTPASLFSMRAG